LFAHPQLAHRQFVHFERLEARLLDRHAAKREPTDRERPDSYGPERGRADRKRDHAGGGNGFGSADEITRHRWVSVRQLVFGAGEAKLAADPEYRPSGGRTAMSSGDGRGAIPICRACAEDVFSRRANIAAGRGPA
jgi:hypothetical protein